MKKQMLNLPFYSKKKLILAYEYGVVIADVAKIQNVEMNKELMLKVEKMIVNEFKKQPERIALEMIPNILSVFETK